MSSSIGATELELVAGFGMLSGRMLREVASQIASQGRLSLTSGFIAHGRRDNVLPIEWAHEADA